MTIKRITHSNTEQRTVLPRPFLHQRLNIEVLSLSDGLSITLIKTLYPLPADSTLSMNRTIQLWKKPLENAGQFILAEFQDDIDSPDLEARDAFQACVKTILDRASTVFVRARVHSQPELEAKLLLLKDLKRRASNVYMMDHGGRENKETIDRLMASACLALTPDNQSALDNYWKMLSKNPWAGEHHDMFEKELYMRLYDKTGEVLTAFELLEPPFQQGYGRRLKISLLEAFLELGEACSKERQCAKSEELQFQLDYLRFKGQLILKPLVQAILRKSLLPLLSKPPKKILRLAEKKFADSVATLKDFLLELDSPACCIDLEKIKTTCGFTALSVPYLEYVLSANRKHRERLTKACLELRPYTNLEECLKWAQQKYGFNPGELRAILNEESDYDRTARKYFGLTIPIEADEEFPDEDLSLDLQSLGDPIAYFIERLKKRDNEILALFSTTS